MKLLCIPYPIDRNPEDTYDNPRTHETQRTKRPDIESFLIDEVSIETDSPCCHTRKNWEGFSRNTKISEQCYKKYNRIYYHCDSWEWKPKKLRPRRQEHVGTWECAIDITESWIRTYRFCHFFFQCIGLIGQINGISKCNNREGHYGNKEFFHDISTS